MVLFTYTKEKFDNGDEILSFRFHPFLSGLIVIGAVMGCVTAVQVIIEAIKYW